jgi:hypothetical protein
MGGGRRIFWWSSAIAVAAGWWLACGSLVFLLLVMLPVRDWRPVEIAVMGVTFVFMTLASVISALSLLRLSQKQRREWFSRRTQQCAFAVAGVTQLFVFVAVWAGPPLGVE